MSTYNSLIGHSISFWEGKFTFIIVDMLVLFGERMGRRDSDRFRSREIDHSYGLCHVVNPDELLQIAAGSNTLTEAWPKLDRCDVLWFGTWDEQKTWDNSCPSLCQWWTVDYHGQAVSWRVVQWCRISGKQNDCMFHSTPIGSMYAIYGNIYHQYTPVMLAYIPYIRIRHGTGMVFEYPQQITQFRRDTWLNHPVLMRRSAAGVSWAHLRPSAAGSPQKCTRCLHEMCQCAKMRAIELLVGGEWLPFLAFSHILGC